MVLVLGDASVGSASRDCSDITIQDEAAPVVTRSRKAGTSRVRCHQDDHHCVSCYRTAPALYWLCTLPWILCPGCVTSRRPATGCANSRPPRPRTSRYWLSWAAGPGGRAVFRLLVVIDGGGEHLLF